MQKGLVVSKGMLVRTNGIPLDLNDGPAEAMMDVEP